jgi:hypothetical protein
VDEKNFMKTLIKNGRIVIAFYEFDRAEKIPSPRMRTQACSHRRKPVEKMKMNLSPRSRATEIAMLSVSVAIFDSLNFLAAYL